ncbi:transcriptional regulator [Streptomyces spinoverrucosus]|uniref:Transcriptional regulator n=2 Tax=Streptomyces spinoverrucosus TaxID=284043 RepID=A0A4Y3VSJ5_9ACTN|nr:helix-turn-helix transcriptional regulator [Streptomyces spinoverrucosus]GEC10002.1 transcriptional regulator [Streptomyces spinoverrucosus]GHB75232.1 transcriptional regulator [Streptomyces spinoverrucosus]
MVAGDEFSELLGRLKERSGLSYGVLGKRLHTSASTLHRYVNGDAVPTDYAPVERFARVCKATPEELVELHRRWVLADARRRQKAGGAPAEEEPRARTATEAGNGTAEAGNGAADAAAETSGSEAAAAEVGPEGGRRPSAEAPVARRRTFVLAGAAVAAVLVSAVLVVNVVPGEEGDDRGGKQSVGAASQPGGSVDSLDESASESAAAKGTSASPSTSRSGTPTAPASASRSSGAGAAQGGGSENGATAPTVAVNPYKWEDPCSQHYLVDRQPEQVPPPPSEQDARGWVTALGGVAGGQQMLALTVQGTGKATVVLEELHVRVVEKSAPLAWNDFEMGVGCGGGVETTSFGVDLDAGRPALSPKAGQRDFPYKVSESDPEVFYVFADARAHNVSWYLELDWSSGDQRGTVRVDDNGKPFRTSGNVGRPAYNHPLGSSEWGRNEYTPDIPG